MPPWLTKLLGTYQPPLGSRENPASLSPMYAPAPAISPELARLLQSTLFQDTLTALPTKPFQVRSATPQEEKELWAGLVTRDAPSTARFNNRDIRGERGFGDEFAAPEPEQNRRLLAHEVVHIMDLDKNLPAEDRALVNAIKANATNSPNPVHHGINGEEEYLASVMSYVLAYPNSKYEDETTKAAKQLLHNRLTQKPEKRRSNDDQKNTQGLPGQK